MELQQLIDQTELDMTAAQVKAFFLGVLTAEKPLPFTKALDELLSENPEDRGTLETQLRAFWDDLEKNKKKELASLFPTQIAVNDFIEIARDQLDYFLTGLTLSGTNSESCKDEDLAELIDELEDTVADFDDYLSDEGASKKDGEDFRMLLLETWEDFVGSAGA